MQTNRGESQRLSITHAYKLAQSRNGKCLSTKYINAHGKLTWQCDCGHQWIANYNSIQRGSWCPKCARKRSGSTQRLSIEDAKKLAHDRDGYCLSKKYLNTKQKLTWQCSEGHVWKTTISSIKSGTWCHQCSLGINEQICRAVLQNAFQQKFNKIKPKWLLNSRGKVMELDGYNKNLNLAFEYNGIQHYKHNNFFHQGERSLKRQQEDDDVKVRICLAKNVNLIVIPYNISKENLATFIFNKCKYFGYKKNQNNFFWNYSDLEHRFTGKLFKIKSQAELLGGKCLSTKYIDSKSKLDFQCSEGHKWKATPQHIFKGSWCPYCGVKKRAETIKHDSAETIKLMQSLATIKGGRCLSTEYLGCNENLLFKCHKGHEWYSLPYVIRKGHWCPICAHSGPNAKKNIEDCKKLASEKNGECLSTAYYGANKKLKWRCEKGHEWEASYNGMRRGWCSKCGSEIAANKLRKSIEDAKAIALEKGGECLSEEYINARTYLKWRCKKGHEWKSTYGNISGGSWCFKCGHKKSWETRKKLREQSACT